MAFHLQEHRDNLKRCCRVCGGLYGKVAKAKASGYDCNGKDKKSGAPFAELLQHVFGVYVEYDDPDVYPDKFCHKCYLILGKWCHAQERKRKYNPAARSYPWQPHNCEACPFCARFVGGKKTGKGKRQPKRCEAGKSELRKSDSNNQSNQPPVNQHASIQHHNDHCYSTLSTAATLFARARKRKRADDLPRANKKRIMSIEMIDTLKNYKLASLFSAENCIKHWVQRFTCCAEADCEEILSLRDLKACDFVFGEVILDLPMQCAYAGCTEKLTVRTFEAHIQACNYELQSSTSDEDSTDDSLHIDERTLSYSSTDESMDGSVRSTSSLDNSTCSSPDSTYSSLDSVCSTSSNRGRPRQPNTMNNERQTQ